jgi:hypothetical protein
MSTQGFSLQGEGPFFAVFGYFVRRLLEDDKKQGVSNLPTPQNHW